VCLGVCVGVGEYACVFVFVCVETAGEGGEYAHVSVYEKENECTLAWHTNSVSRHNIKCV
jgi:hypothetical protein